MFTLINSAPVQDMTTIKVKAGTYYIGDPCYCFGNKNDTWDDLISAMFPDTDATNPIPIVGDVQIAVFTLEGDGEYSGNIDYNGVTKKFEFPVDASLIGLVPVQFIEPDSTHITNNEESPCGFVFTSAKDFLFYYNHNIITLAGDDVYITIYTSQPNRNERDYYIHEERYWDDDEKDDEDY